MRNIFKVFQAVTDGGDGLVWLQSRVVHLPWPLSARSFFYVGRWKFYHHEWGKNKEPAMAGYCFSLTHARVRKRADTVRADMKYQGLCAMPSPNGLGTRLTFLAMMDLGGGLPLMMTEMLMKRVMLYPSAVAKEAELEAAGMTDIHYSPLEEMVETESLCVLV